MLLPVPPIAHAGHWFLWVLYAVPIAIVLGSILATVLRDRGEHADEESPVPGPPEAR